MMNDNDLIKKISDKNVNIDEFVETVLNDEKIRIQVVNQMLTNNNIMVYYHCYYIVSKASEIKPELFYEYWNDFASLLNHKNSYHRDIGLTIIANLTKVDENDLFSSLYKKYIKHFNDEKFMTSQCFVKNIKKIIKNKSEYEKQIINLLLDVDKICAYPTKQKELLKSNIIELFDEVYENTIYKDIIKKFVISQSSSVSPKTKKKVRGFVKKYGDIYLGDE